MIRTEYVHNTHYENLPQPDETPHFENLSLDIYRILWYTKIVIDSMHAFLLGGVGCLAYVRRDSPVHVVRFVRYVTLIGDYYALLRSRFALCLYGFCRMALQLLGTLERRRGALCPFAFLLTMEKLQLYSPRRLCYNSLVLGVSRCTGQEISACREASLGRSKLGRSKLGRNGENIGRSAPYRSEKNVEYLEEHLN